MGQGKATARIPLRQETFERMKEFCHGLDMTNDEVINKFLDRFIHDGEEPLLAGFRLREEFRNPYLLKEKPHDDER